MMYRLMNSGRDRHQPVGQRNVASAEQEEGTKGVAEEGIETRNEVAAPNSSEASTAIAGRLDVACVDQRGCTNAVAAAAAVGGRPGSGLKAEICETPSDDGAELVDFTAPPTREAQRSTSTLGYYHDSMSSYDSEEWACKVAAGDAGALSARPTFGGAYPSGVDVEVGPAPTSYDLCRSGGSGHGSQGVQRGRFRREIFSGSTNAGGESGETRLGTRTGARSSSVCVLPCRSASQVRQICRARSRSPPSLVGIWEQHYRKKAGAGRFSIGSDYTDAGGSVGDGAGHQNGDDRERPLRAQGDSGGAGRSRFIGSTLRSDSRRENGASGEAEIEERGQEDEMQVQLF